MQKLQFIIGGSQAFIRLGKNPALILGEFNKDALGLVALQEALADWNEKQAYIAQYAGQEDAQPAPDLSLQARIEDDIRHGKKMDFLKKYYQEEDTDAS